jgi:hypothetical protein
MDQSIDWRSPYFPKIFEQYDRADFAQEFLRRNPAYRRQFAAARGGTRTSAAALGRVARQWGLVFRPGPRS